MKILMLITSLLLIISCNIFSQTDTLSKQIKLLQAEQEELLSRQVAEFQSRQEKLLNQQLKKLQEEQENV